MVTSKTHISVRRVKQAAPSKSQFSPDVKVVPGSPQHCSKGMTAHTEQIENYTEEGAIARILAGEPFSIPSHVKPDC